MMNFGLISELKIFTLTMMAIFLLVTVSINGVHNEVMASSERPDAYAEWDKSSVFTTTGTAMVRVVDKYMNMDPDLAETVTAHIYTERNENNPELKVTLTETDRDTGIFEATIFFTETKSSSGNTLQVVDGDVVSVEYTYSQIPDSEKREDMIGVGQEKTIKNQQNSKPLSINSDRATSISLDRDEYPVPFGSISDFEEIVSRVPESRSIFPLHHTTITTGKISESDTLGNGDVIIHVKINDPAFNSSSDIDKISKDISGKDVGPLKISVSRNSQTVVLAYAGGSTPNEDGLVDVGGNNHSIARQTGPIFEDNANDGTFVLDFAVRYTDGPADAKCPATAMFASLNESGVKGSELSRFDLPSSQKENYCIMNGDTLTVEYTTVDSAGKTKVVTDSATFTLRDGFLRTDHPTYVIGSDMILTLVEPDLDLDGNVAESYDLDLLEWDSNAATLTMGERGGEISRFDPEPVKLRETGTDTGIFQILVEIPKELNGNALDRGEEVVLEYTDWGPTSAQYVGQEDEDINAIIYTSDFGATLVLDKKIYSWTDAVHITVTSPDHNFDSDLIDEIGNTKQYPVRIMSNDFALDNYKLVETGLNTGIFEGKVALTGFLHDADGNKITGNNGTDTNPRTSGSGPVDGLLQVNSKDSVAVSFQFSEEDTVVGSALVRWNEGKIKWLEDSYPASGTGVIRVTDPDMNLNPDRIDNFDIDVWSDSDLGGIDLTVTETDDATGIFEGTVFFTTTDESSGHRLRVIEGDTLTAEYEDNTLPEPYTPADEQDITAKSMIQELPMSPLKQQMSGVLPNDVACKKGLEKVFRYDGSAACASPLTAEKLSYRGWGTSDAK